MLPFQASSMADLPQFTHPDKIQVLHLENNPIKTLSDKIFMLRDMINLQKVYLQNCSLEAIHQNAFQSLVLMIELDLSNNNIKTLLPGTFEGNIRIRKLWLQNNPLKSLHEFNFPSIPHLKSSTCRVMRGKGIKPQLLNGRSVWQANQTEQLAAGRTVWLNKLARINTSADQKAASG